ncbi:MAG TPA: M50 family metallopeptidase [Candidatus Monoglobus merdigallinarum]|uniref:M50 family metallopeptidase n=1 Tax=Candidatus Monoglobus merdigallinarum TaxID=2838698 RepID=A0A9D1PR97_9FIRM|nr:M50 family metallopeptidase [Candidatus Monoglobus merdigallinarum]
MRFFSRISGVLKAAWLIPVGEKAAVCPWFIVLAAASVVGGYAGMFFGAYAFALLHELAHLCAARLLGVGVERIEILPFGICGRLSQGFVKSPVKEVMIAAAGPLMSGVLAASLCMAAEHAGPRVNTEVLRYSLNLNLSLMIINLIPALPLDGGRIVKGLLSLKYGGIRALNIMVKLSRFPIAAVLGISVWLLLTSEFNMPLILIGAFLLGNLASEQKNVGMSTLRELLYYKDRLEKNGFSPVVRLAAHSSVKARLFLKRLGFYRYHIIDVVDDDGHILKTITESELIGALINRSIRITVGEI